MTLWVRRLLFANVTVFLLVRALPGEIVNQLVLVPVLVPVRPWSVLTYQFLHAGFWHLLMNMIGLYFFGPRLEARIGSRHFLLLYLLSGVGGAVLSILTPRAFIVGASGAVFGVLLGFARYWPRERIYIYAVIPVEARILVVFLAALSLWSGIGGGGNIAHFAHLGGFVGGWIYLNVMERRSPGRRFRRKVEAAGLGRPAHATSALGGGGQGRPPPDQPGGVRPRPREGEAGGDTLAHGAGAGLHGASRGGVGAASSPPGPGAAGATSARNASAFHEVARPAPGPVCVSRYARACPREAP